MTTSIEKAKEAITAVNIRAAGTALWYEVIRNGLRVCTVDNDSDAIFIYGAIAEGELPWKHLALIEVRDFGPEIKDVLLLEQSRD